MNRAARSSVTTELMAELAVAGDAEERARIIDLVVLTNRQVADAIARRYRDRGVPLDDLVQVGYEGLVKAATRFDPTLAEDFLTYAVPTVRGEIQRYFRDHGWTVRPPRRVQELQTRLNRVVAELGQELGREPSHREVTDRLGVTAEAYGEAIRAYGCFSPPSLDRPIEPGAGTTIGDVVVGDPDVGLSPLVELAPLVRTLSERDRRIVYLRFFEDRTQTQIGTDLGISQMQVSRLLGRILDQLRQGLAPDEGARVRG